MMYLFFAATCLLRIKHSPMALHDGCTSTENLISISLPNKTGAPAPPRRDEAQVRLGLLGDDPTSSHNGKEAQNLTRHLAMDRHTSSMPCAG